MSHEIRTPMNAIIGLDNIALKNSDTFKNSDQKADNQRVFVIDDDSVTREHAKIVLDEVEIASDTCAGDKEAFEMIKIRHIRRLDYNLILIDLKMPELDGFETAKIIRDMICDDVILIILTVYNFDGLKNEARDAKIDKFMSKPLFTSNSHLYKHVEPDQLYKTLAELIN